MKKPGNSGLLWVLLVMLLALAIVLPISWMAIQAERKQSESMKAMAKQLKALDVMNKAGCVPEKLTQTMQQLLLQTQRINAAFPILAGSKSEFPKLSGAMERSAISAQAEIANSGCVALPQQLKMLKQQCQNCHDQFRQNTPR
jgi:cytochrome c556